MDQVRVLPSALQSPADGHSALQDKTPVRMPRMWPRVHNTGWDGRGRFLPNDSGFRSCPHAAL